MSNKFRFGDRIKTLDKPDYKTQSGTITDPNVDDKGEVGVRFDFYPADEQGLVEYGHPQDDLELMEALVEQTV